MKKTFLVLFILVDLAIMGGAAYFLYGYMTRLPASAPASTVAKPVAVPQTSTATTPSLFGSAPAVAPVPSGDASMRKILFTYHNSKARQVAIRADFTGWKAEVMSRDDRGVWTYQAHLLPGEYAYCFTVDDKTFKDPANKKTKQIGRTFVSAIVVEALK